MTKRPSLLLHGFVFDVGGKGMIEKKGNMVQGESRMIELPSVLASSAKFKEVARGKSV